MYRLRAIWLLSGPSKVHKVTLQLTMWVANYNGMLASVIQVIASCLMLSGTLIAAACDAIDLTVISNNCLVPIRQKLRYLHQFAGR